MEKQLNFKPENTSEVSIKTNFASVFCFQYLFGSFYGYLGGSKFQYFALYISKDHLNGHEFRKQTKLRKLTVANYRPFKIAFATFVA